MKASGTGWPYHSCPVPRAPAYNEEESIAQVILRVQGLVDHLIVCDDGSTDLTGLIAERLGAIIPNH
ncbi:glycosyltransferase [Candidatus Bathyarchaeota archaeon]|nr:glycosyltransferase [Candidatus Bathyarchaeota archaeon]